VLHKKIIFQHKKGIFSRNKFITLHEKVVYQHNYYKNSIINFINTIRQ
jgi:hypothetical protein